MIESVSKIRIEDFDYPLPEERIALHPLERRDACKLLVANAAGKISHHIFSDLPLFLRPDTLIVANETKVIHARTVFEKPSGAKIEIFLLEPASPSDYVTNFESRHSCSWICLIGNRKRWKEGVLEKKLELGPGKEPVTLSAQMGCEVEGNGVEVRFRWDNDSFSFAEILEAAGHIPIPPYLKRDSEKSDDSDYQTVYGLTEGSVAAPTAGLHFTPELIGELRRSGDEFVTVTLHVGAGTFQPVKSEKIGDHPMHTEWISVSRATLRRVIAALENGRDILAVGTTSVRTLESLPYLGLLASKGCDLKVTQWMPYEEEYRRIDTLRSLHALDDYMKTAELEALETTTSIMIAPGFRWRVVNRLVTNFHQPKSTLLLLVSSFLGNDGEGNPRWRKVYDEALKDSYRFLSYGDACLFPRGRQDVELPLSKSMTLRAMVISAVNHPDSPYLIDRIPQECDDAAFLAEGLKKTMLSVLRPGSMSSPVYIGEGAAPLRFLVAYAASLPGAKVRITCAEGLQRRPVKPLVSALKEMGADIEFYDETDNWHIDVCGRKLAGGRLNVDGSFTSQYVSALLLASPLWLRPIELGDGGEVSVSRPYVRMTEKMMEQEEPRIETDWSAAAFFYEYAFVSKRNVGIACLTPPAESLQGDSAVCDIYTRLGVNTRFNPDGSAVIICDPALEPLLSQYTEDNPLCLDFTDFPDMAPSVAVALCYRGVPFRFSGVGHLRFKECDRLSVLYALLTKLGYGISIENENLVFNGEFRPLYEFPVEIDPSGDHRMAMAFYPLELQGMAVVLDKEVVRKSFPNFYQQF